MFAKVLMRGESNSNPVGFKMKKSGTQNSAVWDSKSAQKVHVEAKDEPSVEGRTVDVRTVRPSSVEGRTKFLRTDECSKS